jgi:hypothetical protein
MKILYYENTCNNGSVTVRYLRDLGYDAHLALTVKDSESENHARPENDLIDSKYNDLYHYPSFMSNGILRAKRNEIEKWLDQFNFIMGGDWIPYLCSKVDRNLNIMVPHGTDVFRYPFPRITTSIKHTIANLLLSSGQRKGMRRLTKAIMTDYTNPQYEIYIDRAFCNSEAKRFFQSVPLLYFPEYQSPAFSVYKESSPQAIMIRRLKDSGKQILFSHCSHYWHNRNDDFFCKRNDLLIRGVYEYIKKSKNRDIQLVLIERGPDVVYSKRLVYELGIDRYVTWIREMARKDIMACLYYVDVGIGELGHSFITYSVLSEFLCSAVPIICKCEYEYHPGTGSELYPMVRASNSEDVAVGIEFFLMSQDCRKSFGVAGQNWWKNYCERSALNTITDQLRSA